MLEPHYGFMVWALIAFLCVLFILGKFAWPAIIKGLKERESNINDSIAAAERVKLEMAQMKSDNERLLGQAREERAALLKEAKEARDKMINDAKDEAKKQADKIITDAQLVINQQKQAAMTDIKNQVGNLVVEVSEKVLRKELANRPEQENYIHQLAQSVKLN